MSEQRTDEEHGAAGQDGNFVAPHEHPWAEEEDGSCTLCKLAWSAPRVLSMFEEAARQHGRALEAARMLRNAVVLALPAVDLRGARNTAAFLREAIDSTGWLDEEEGAKA